MREPEPPLPDGPIVRYLGELRRRLRANPRTARRAIEEVSDHLQEAAAAARREGMSESEAEGEAVRRMGPVGSLADGLRRGSASLRIALGLATAASGLAQLWLLYVITVVLPSRDPDHLVFWQRLTACLSLYNGICLLQIFRGAAGRILTPLLLFTSVTAAGAGAYGILWMLAAVRSGHEFEGYIILLGAILIAQSVSAIVYAISAVRARRRLARC